MKPGRSIIFVDREFGHISVQSIMVDVVRDDEGNITATCGETVEDPEWQGEVGASMDDEPQAPTVLMHYGADIELDEFEIFEAHSKIDEINGLIAVRLKSECAAGHLQEAA